jgi:chromosome segregation ATPase
MNLEQLTQAHGRAQKTVLDLSNKVILLEGEIESLQTERESMINRVATLLDITARHEELLSTLSSQLRALTTELAVGSPRLSFWDRFLGR